MTAIFRKRRNLFEKGEDEWRIENGELVWRKAGGKETRYALKDVVHVRATYLPTQVAPWRHMFVITFKRGQPIRLDNAHFKGFGDFEDRSSSYTPFVKELIAEIAKAAPKADGHIGARPWAYVLSLVLLTLIFGLLAVIFIAFEPQPNALLFARLGIILLLLPLFLRWLARARPRGVPLDPAAFTAGLPEG